MNIILNKKYHGYYLYTSFIIVFLLLVAGAATAQKKSGINIVPVDSGWANNSVNAVIFRKNSLATHGNTQYIAFYDQQRYVVLGKRELGSKQWQIKRTPYRGNAADAHNSISIMTDGAGYLHIAWDHHNNPLHYCRSLQPGSLDLGDEMPMTGDLEKRVSYPEFYRLSDGNLLFFYRNGQSGQGNLVINRYNVATQQWTRLQSNLVDGEGQRNAYWQACVDRQGTIHISWVWRETPDVASNHDMCYARSKDGGITWEKSTGEKYNLPVTAATAEYACHIPRNSELINQTSMFADASGNPYIATYWREEGSAIPQYHLIFKKDGQWQIQDLGFRKTGFSLSGAGTKSIPISRPQFIAWPDGKKICAALIFRDAEYGNKVSVAINKNISKNRWTVVHLMDKSVGSWEPTYDTELWKNREELHLFIQRVTQVDGEGRADVPPQPVEVLEWKPGSR